MQEFELSSYLVAAALHRHPLELPGVESGLTVDPAGHELQVFEVRSQNIDPGQEQVSLLLIEAAPAHKIPVSQVIRKLTRVGEAHQPDKASNCRTHSGRCGRSNLHTDSSNRSQPILLSPKKGSSARHLIYGEGINLLVPPQGKQVVVLPKSGCTAARGIRHRSRRSIGWSFLSTGCWSRCIGIERRGRLKEASLQWVVHSSRFRKGRDRDKKKSSLPGRTPHCPLAWLKEEPSSQAQTGAVSILVVPTGQVTH